MSERVKISRVPASGLPYRPEPVCVDDDDLPSAHGAPLDLALLERLPELMAAQPRARYRPMVSQREYDRLEASGCDMSRWWVNARIPVEAEHE